MPQDNLDKIVTCETLRNNFELYRDKFGTLPKEAGFINDMNFMVSDPKNLVKSMEIYEVHISQIIESFSIPSQERSSFRNCLEEAANIYLLLFMYKFVGISFEGWLAQIDKLANSARKLENQITDLIKTDPDFFQKLKFFNHFEEKHPNAPSVDDFFNNLLLQLRILKKLRFGVNSSNLGKAYGFGVASRKKNHALNNWISTLYKYWEDVLGRDMKRDKTGLSGRKRFLEFLAACIAPLHPEIISNFDDPLERLDTALKAHQKNLKVLGENVP